MHIGNRVLVSSGGDETFDAAYLGLFGVVVGIAEHGAGVGESPGDPFITVLLDSDKIDGFWSEELTVFN